jgi:hypothetical protein
VGKSTVVKIFLGSVIAFIAGAVLALVAVLVGFANGAFVMSGPDVTGLQPAPSTWAMVGLFVVAALAVIGGSVGGLVSWIGALLNTAQIDDKTWFVVLLVLGLLSFGLVAMIVYVIAGPDGTQQKDARLAATIAATTAATSSVVMGPPSK